MMKHRISNHPGSDSTSFERKIRKGMHISLSRDVVKVLAVTAMTGNHIAHVFLEPDTLLYETLIGIGYFTAITMCFLLVEGYHHTVNLRAYALRLILFGLTAQAPYYALFGLPRLNILFTLALCLGIVHTMNQKHWPELHRYAIILALYIVSGFFEWGFYIPLCAYFFEKYYDDQKSLYRIYPTLVFTFFMIELTGVISESTPVSFSIIISVLLHTIGPALSALLMLFFYDNSSSGSRHAFKRWFFYIYYPAHICILLLLSSG